MNVSGLGSFAAAKQVHQVVFVNIYNTVRFCKISLVFYQYSLINQNIFESLIAKEMQVGGHIYNVNWWLYTASG